MYMHPSTFQNIYPVRMSVLCMLKFGGCVSVFQPLPSPELQPADVELMLKPRPKFEGMRLEGENVHRSAEANANIHRYMYIVIHLALCLH